MCVKEFLERNSENKAKLNELAELIWPFLKNIYLVQRNRLEFFDDEYVWTFRDWNTFETSSMTLRQIINYDKYLNDLNGAERYFRFIYGH